MSRANDGLRVRSIAFSDGGHIPPKYTCEGDNINPPLEVSNVPENTKSLALIVDDPDARNKGFVHWVVWNIPPNESIGENSKPGISGKNGFGNTGYGGPCPPSGSHRYYFKVFALDTELDIHADSDRKTLEEAMKDHILSSGELMAHYQKRNAR